MSSAKKKVIVAMSGGVDSSVAALLLKNQGYDVAGVHMICADFDLAKQDNEIEHPRFAKRIGIGVCEQAQEDRRDAMRVAARLDIPFLVWDFKKEYKEAVFDYMISEYRLGRTPNPDVMCNREIKFGIFLKKALEAGADFIATGHYTRLEREFPISNFQFPNKLKIAKDSNKDQSYFLWTLTQDQLKHCLFPIGDYLKSEVREIAREAGLPVAAKKDSQGLCFVGKVDFQDFLRGVLPAREGVVLDSEGEVLGRHDGAEFFTIGQRHGLNIGGQPSPIYVAERDLKTNTLVVAKNAEDQVLFKTSLEVSDLNWIAGMPPEFSLSCSARIRYRQPLQHCTLHAISSMLKAVFDEPQRAVAPGQSIVFYTEDGEMLGGGIIK